MFNHTLAFREYLNRRQSIIDSEKPKEANNLFNEKTFYRAFTNDLLNAKKEVIIYSPFVSKFRTDFFKSTIENLRHRNIEIFIFTRPIEEHDSIHQPQIECALKNYEDAGVTIFYLSGSIHEKIAIVDREILWEGSLNILSQRSSKEMMRRILNENSATQVMSCLGLNKKLAESYKLKYERLYRNLLTNSGQNYKNSIRIFLFGLTIPVVVWLVFSNFREIVFFLQFILNMIKIIKP